MEGLRVWNIFWTAPWQKKPWAIFVDSTILVNGYHIYSTACNYNSSVSNLCFACWDASQVFFAVANFPPFLRPIPCPIRKSMLENMQGGGSSHNKTGDQSDVIMSLLHPVSLHPLRTRIVGKRFKVSISETEAIFVCFVPFPDPGLTDSLPLWGWQYPASRDQETDHSLSEYVPAIYIRSLPCQGGAMGLSEITTPIIKTLDKCKAIHYILLH